MATLPCANGAGSINNPDGSPAQTGLNNTSLSVYVPYSPEVGEFEISKVNLSPNCETNDQLRQESYVAETLNIAGAPINIFKLLGVHEQGNGSVLSNGRIISSQPYPGYPVTGVNNAGSWRSLQAGPSTTSSYIGVDFGIKLLPTGNSEYEPHKQNWTKVGAFNITQANTPNEFARQVKVEIADGECEMPSPLFTGVGDGILTVNVLGENVTQGVVTVLALTATTFNVYATLPNNTVIGLKTATVGQPFFSTFINFTITAGLTQFVAGDMFTIPVNYKWKRLGLFNLIQSPLPQTLSLKTAITIKAIKVSPTLFTGTGHWEVSALDVLDSPPTDIDNIQDLFFNENRDRDYSLEPILLKAQYAPADSMSDLSRFGLSILDQYSFELSFADMVKKLGRPIVTGDIIEVIPEMQYDHNLKPIRKFLEVTDTGWASQGFSTMWRPTIYRFSASQATPSQENRDIFGTMDTQKYLVADSILTDGVGEQIDVTPLTQMEEITKESLDAVPERGSDDGIKVSGTHLPPTLPPTNPKGQPTPLPPKGKPNIFIEDGIPKHGEPYGEGYSLPESTTATDGEYFRLYYPEISKIPPRLYRFSVVKNKWLYMETDRRADYSSHKPSVRNILQSKTNQSLKDKTI